MEEYIWRDAPLREEALLSPRFALSAAPAAICCFLLRAGMRQSYHEPNEANLNMRSILHDGAQRK